MFDAALAALREIISPPFRAVLLKSLGMTLVFLILAWVGLDKLALSYAVVSHPWLQTAVDRPFLFAFEDGGGILPIHNVGLSATGRIPSGGLGLHYIAEIGNGRTSRSLLDAPVQNHIDENNGKSFNVGLYARPASLPGLQAGFSLYRDTLHPEGNAKTGQTIYAGHLVYNASGMEFLTEGLLLRHALEIGRAHV